MEWKDPQFTFKSRVESIFCRLCQVFPSHWNSIYVMMLSRRFFPIKLLPELNRIFRLSETWNTNILKKEEVMLLPNMEASKRGKKNEPPPRRCTCWQRCLCSRCPSSPPPRLSTTSSSSPCPTFYQLRTSAWWESHTILLIIILNHFVVLPLTIFAHITMVIPTPSPSSTTLLSSSFILIISFRYKGRRKKTVFFYF